MHTGPQENPIYYAGAVVWITKKLAKQSSSSFFIGRIFAVLSKIDMSESKLSMHAFCSILKSVLIFLESNQVTISETRIIAETLQKIDTMYKSLSKIHSLYSKSVALLFKPKTVVDQEKYYEFTNYLWILYCFARGISNEFLN